MLADFIRAVAAAREIDTPTRLHAHLRDAGFVVSPQAVALWWTGETKRLDDARARALVKALSLTAGEIDALRDVQSGLGEPTEGRAA